MFFFRKKKKKHTALMVLAIVFGALAVAAGAYVLFTKVLKGKLCKKCAAEVDAIDCDDCEEILDEVCDCEAEYVEDIEAEVEEA